MLTAIRQWVIKTMTKGQTGVVTIMPKQQIVEMNTQITAERILRNGINPEDLKTVGQVENVINQIDQPKVISADSAEGKGITEQLLGKKKAPVFDMEGNKIDTSKGIMGGKEINQKILNEELMKTDNAYSDLVNTPRPRTLAEREADVLAGMEKNNKEMVQRIRERKKVDDSIAKIKSMEPMDAMKEANLVAGKKGKYANLDDNQVKKIMDDTQDHIFERDIPDEDFATGGRVGLKGGSFLNFIKNMGKTINDKSPVKVYTDYLKSVKERVKAGKEAEVAGEVIPIAAGGALITNQVKKKLKAMNEEQKKKIKEEMEKKANGGRIGLFLGGNLEGGYSESRKDSGGKQTTVSFGGGDGGNNNPPPPRNVGNEKGIVTLKKDIPTFNTDFSKFSVKDLIDFGIINPEEENTKVAEAINFNKLGIAKDLFTPKSTMTTGSVVDSFMKENPNATKGDFVNALQSGSLGVGGSQLFDKNVDSLFEGVNLGKSMSPFDVSPTFIGTEDGSFRGNIDIDKGALDKDSLKALPAGFFVGADGGRAALADGGRIGLKGGMTKRAFMKLMGGVGASIGAAKSGIFSGFGKGAGKTVAKEVAQQTTSSMPPPYFFKLAEKIKMMGDDATATTDRTIAKTLDSKDGKSTYLLEEDVSTGDTIIKKINKEEDMITNVEIMELKKGEVVQGKDGKALKTPDQYEEVTESNSRIYKDEFNDPNYEDGIQVDEIIKEVDDKVPSIKYASGGLAYMLGE